ncbi:uncharacterized protein BDW70DRAFT_68061 [Aspergillus foveolatus]|uniref:uncharacterized protein n=1 Tax=Aspergillus foveolatus TaxID=210207 RepID=UPI003CCDB3A6
MVPAGGCWWLSLDSPVWRDPRCFGSFRRHPLYLSISGLSFRRDPEISLHNASPDAVLSSMTLHSRYWFCFCFSELISALFGNRTFWRIMVLITDGIHGTDCWGCWGIPFDPAITAFGHTQHTDRGL